MTTERRSPILGIDPAPDGETLVVTIDGEVRMLLGHGLRIDDVDGVPRVLPIEAEAEQLGTLVLELHSIGNVARRVSRLLDEVLEESQTPAAYAADPFAGIDRQRPLRSSHASIDADGKVTAHPSPPVCMVCGGAIDGHAEVTGSRRCDECLDVGKIHADRVRLADEVRAWRHTAALMRSSSGGPYRGKVHPDMLRGARLGPTPRVDVAVNPDGYGAEVYIEPRDLLSLDREETPALGAALGIPAALLRPDRPAGLNIGTTPPSAVPFAWDSAELRIAGLPLPLDYGYCWAHRRAVLLSGASSYTVKLGPDEVQEVPFPRCGSTESARFTSQELRCAPSHELRCAREARHIGPCVSLELLRLVYRDDAPQRENASDDGNVASENPGPHTSRPKDGGA